MLLYNRQENSYRNILHVICQFQLQNKRKYVDGKQRLLQLDILHVKLIQSAETE